MASLKFNLERLSNAESVGATQEPVGDLVDNLPFNQLPRRLRFSRMGGTPPFFRSGVPRVAFMKLAGTGLLVAFVGMQTSNESAAFSCALAAAVNIIACFHYYMIWQIRAQHLPESHIVFSAGRDAKGRWKGMKEDDEDDAKVFAQEMAVDGLR